MKTLSLNEPLFDISTHPSQHLVLIASLSGNITCVNYKSNSDHLVQFKKSIHTDSCRSISWSRDGNKVLSASSDSSFCILDASNGKVLTRKPHAHKDAVNCIQELNTNVIATGDDSGFIKIWDIRAKQKLYSAQVHSDYISNLSLFDDSQLISVSGDGHLSCIDIRHLKKDPILSEYQETELMCVSKLLKNKRKFVTGTENGFLLIWNYGQYQDHTDRLPLDVSSSDPIQCIASLKDGSTLLTATQQGILRKVSILPNAVLEKIGTHSTFSLEALALSFDEEYLLSCGHEGNVEFWNLKEKKVGFFDGLD